jgi:hypothetical protein
MPFLPYAISSTPSKYNIYSANSFVTVSVSLTCIDFLIPNYHVDYLLLRSLHSMCPHLRQCITYYIILTFYSEALLATQQIPRLVDNHLVHTCNCLFSTFPVTLCIWRMFLLLQPEDVPCYHNSQKESRLL